MTSNAFLTGLFTGMSIGTVIGLCIAAWHDGHA